MVSYKVCISQQSNLFYMKGVGKKVQAVVDTASKRGSEKAADSELR